MTLVTEAFHSEGRMDDSPERAAATSTNALLVQDLNISHVP